jgi:hypothetical protein
MVHFENRCPGVSLNIFWTILLNFSVVNRTATISARFQQKFNHIYCLQLTVKSTWMYALASDNSTLTKSLMFSISSVDVHPELLLLLLLLVVVVLALLLFLLQLLPQSFIFISYKRLQTINTNISNFTMFHMRSNAFTRTFWIISVVFHPELLLLVVVVVVLLFLLLLLLQSFIFISYKRLQTINTKISNFTTFHMRSNAYTRTF